MRNIYYFARKEDRNIKGVDESGNECEFPYEIIVYMD